MGRDPLQNKTALVLGADTPFGRAIALQFAKAGSQVILAGGSTAGISPVADLIKVKRGDALEAVLPQKKDKILAILREKRDTLGHIHFVANTLGMLSDDEEDEGSFDRARELNEIVLELIQGKGTVRLATLWPDRAGDPPVVPDSFWHTLVRFDRIPHEAILEGREGTLRPAAVADSLIHLFHCPPGACPVEVRFMARAIKA